MTSAAPVTDAQLFNLFQWIVDTAEDENVSIQFIQQLARKGMVLLERRAAAQNPPTSPLTNTPSLPPSVPVAASVEASAPASTPDGYGTCSGPLPGHHVTIVQTGDKTHFVQSKTLPWE